MLIHHIRQDWLIFHVDLTNKCRFFSKVIKARGLTHMGEVEFVKRF